MVEKLLLTRKQWQSMRRHVSRHFPQEACGLLAGRDGRAAWALGIPNAERSPVRFRMEPRAQLRAFERIEAEGLDLLGIYHSHPAGPDHPSPTDIAEAMYPVVHLILWREGRNWRVRAFRIAEGKYREITLEFAKAE